jgi:hypothetical protein
MDTENKFSTSMEKEHWIQNIINSTAGMTPVMPSNHLLFKIQQRTKPQKKVSDKTVWLVAASILVLIALNFTVLLTKTKESKSTTTAYFENTLNKSNQLYQ